MNVKLRKKELPKKVAGKLGKITSRPKKINWDKYFGKIEFPRYFPRNTLNKSLMSFNLPLYYTDPGDGATFAQKFSIFAGLGGQTPQTLDVSDIEPTPFCNRYVLLVERSANTSPINLQNVEDIELTFNMRSGRPALSTGFAW